MPTSRPVVAAFDLDGTLTKGGSVVSWLRYVGGTRLVARSIGERLLPLAFGALASGRAADEAKESLFRAVLCGRPYEEVQLRSAAFAQHHLATELRSEIRDRLNWHLAEGHRVVVVSASPEIYVGVVAAMLGAHGHVGTRLAVDPMGRLTGGYLGRNCRGREKVRRLQAWISEQDFGDVAPELYAYGNSRGDRKMLGAAEHPYDVGQLGRLGALKAFPRLD